MSEDRDLLDLAVQTAHDAGELRRQGPEERVEVAETKSSRTEVVTANDVASENLIRARILAARPSDGFLGEEGASVEGTSGVRWIADPIDGTVNYLYGIPQYAVSLAAERDGRVVERGVHGHRRQPGPGGDRVRLPGRRPRPPGRRAGTAGAARPRHPATRV